MRPCLNCRDLLRAPRVLARGVTPSAFAGAGAPADSTLFCAASLGDPRKRGELLLAAWNEVRDRRPGARLLLAGGRDPVMSGARPALAEGVEAIDPSSTEALAGAYAAATATVLPSVDEAFGLVLIESLAAGTPVVAARSGATPEIVTDERVGRLFKPDDGTDLVRAITEALDLGADPATGERCRAHAAAWDWSTVVGDYEAVYDSLIASDSRGR